MKLDMQALSYLRGDTFSNGWKFSIPPQPNLITRNARLVELSTGKSVLHLGCVDHTDLIEEKIRRGTYLHTLLAAAANHLTGIDINGPGIDKMKQLGFSELYLPSTAPTRSYDLLIASDVIEHVTDPIQFLIDLKRYTFDQLILTTPNGYRRQNRRQYRAEIINTDHNCWFSPFTLSKVLYRAGYGVIALEFTDRPSNINMARNTLLRRFPLLQDGLLAIASPCEPHLER